MQIEFLKKLRDKIISRFEVLENGAKFERTTWDYSKGTGGGEMSVLRGKVFEKAAVNWSGVGGKEFPMQDGKGSFFATGISLITHMANPHAPTVHMNIRFIQTDAGNWFGGGYDLTPMGFPYEEDTEHFHEVARKTLGDELYAEFTQNAKAYFYVPHRLKERGVGGIFFDHYNTGDFNVDLAMWQSVGETFLDAIMPIYERRVNMPYSEEEKSVQIKLRGHYVEFNLLYDRGTKFGFLSGGNPDAILCSLPPLVSW